MGRWRSVRRVRVSAWSFGRAVKALILSNCVGVVSVQGHENVFLPTIWGLGGGNLCDPEDSKPGMLSTRGKTALLVVCVWHVITHAFLERRMSLTSDSHQISLPTSAAIMFFGQALWVRLPLSYQLWSLQNCFCLLLIERMRMHGVARINHHNYRCKPSNQKQWILSTHGVWTSWFQYCLFLPTCLCPDFGHADIHRGNESL